MNSDACNGHMFQFTPSTAVHTSRPTPKSVTFISNASGQTIFGDCSISATAINKGQGDAEIRIPLLCCPEMGSQMWACWFRAMCNILNYGGTEKHMWRCREGYRCGCVDIYFGADI